MSAHNLVHAAAMKRASIVGNVNAYINKLHEKMVSASAVGRYSIQIPSNEMTQEVKEELIKAGYGVTHSMGNATITWEN